MHKSQNVLLNTRSTLQKDALLFIYSSKICKTILFFLNSRIIHILPIFKIFYLFIYLFIWLHRVLVAAHEISRCGTRAPEHTGSAAVAPGKTILCLVLNAYIKYKYKSIHGLP